MQLCLTEYQRRWICRSEIGLPETGTITKRKDRELMTACLKKLRRGASKADLRKIIREARAK